jgi:hypothetical protein
MSYLYRNAQYNGLFDEKRGSRDGLPPYILEDRKWHLVS